MKKSKTLIIVGLTGAFGCGKSTAAEFFGREGAIIINADDIVHELYRLKSKCWYKIKNCFGDEILNKDKTVNRAKLSQIVFASHKQLKKLSAIAHPEVIREIKSRVKHMQKKYKKGVILIDAPLLFETGLDKICDFTVCVWTRQYVQIKRALKKRTLSKSQVIRRIRAQMPIKEKKYRSDFVVDNSGSLLKLQKQVAEVLAEIGCCEARCGLKGVNAAHKK